MNDEEQRLIEVAKMTGIQGISVGLKHIYPLGIDYEEVRIQPPPKIQGKIWE